MFTGLSGVISVNKQFSYFEQVYSTVENDTFKDLFKGQLEYIFYGGHTDALGGVVSGAVIRVGAENERRRGRTAGQANRTVSRISPIVFTLSLFRASSIKHHVCKQERKRGSQRATKLRVPGT